MDQYKNIDKFYLVNLYYPLNSICQHKKKKVLHNPYYQEILSKGQAKYQLLTKIKC